jgi:hypothetical protein
LWYRLPERVDLYEKKKCTPELFVGIFFSQLIDVYKEKPYESWKIIIAKTYIGQGYVQFSISQN